jgi:hypothetical protein
LNITRAKGCQKCEQSGGEIAKRIQHNNKNIIKNNC